MRCREADGLGLVDAVLLCVCEPGVELGDWGYGEVGAVERAFCVLCGLGGSAVAGGAGGEDFLGGGSGGGWGGGHASEGGSWGLGPVGDAVEGGAHAVVI